MKVFCKGNKQKKMHRIRLPLHVYLSYLLVATFLFTGVSFSKYASSASAQSSAQIAAFSISVEGETSDALVLDVSDETQKSDSYSFRVTSNSEVMVTDVVTVTLPEVLPEGIHMTMTVNSEEIASDSNGGTYTFVKNFEVGEESHLWTLTFFADPDVIALGEEYVMDNIGIHVDAVQIE